MTLIALADGHMQRPARCKLPAASNEPGAAVSILTARASLSCGERAPVQLGEQVSRFSHRASAVGWYVCMLISNTSHDAHSSFGFVL